MKTEKEKGWRHLRWSGLERLVQNPDPRLRWRWNKVLARKRAKLQIISPRGRPWTVHVTGRGIWIAPPASLPNQPTEQPEPTTPHEPRYQGP